MRLKKQILYSFLFFTFTVSLLSGCDTIKDFLQNLSRSPKPTEETTEYIPPSYEKTILLDILNRQKTLSEEIQFAKSSGDKENLQEAFNELFRLEQRYQDEFDKNVGKLTARESIEISDMHMKIIKGIPKPTF